MVLFIITSPDETYDNDPQAQQTSSRLWNSYIHKSRITQSHAFNEVTPTQIVKRIQVWHLRHHFVFEIRLCRNIESVKIVISQIGVTYCKIGE